MKLNIEEMAKQADFWVALHDVGGALVYEAEPKHLEAFARLIVERCATIAQEYPKYGEATAEEIRNLLEAE